MTQEMAQQQQAQQYSSAHTSINSKKVPRLFRMISWQPGTANLDYGGGKWDTATEYLRGKGVANCIYDPYNRTAEHNAAVLARRNYDTVTISNVLNVIKEEAIQRGVIEKALDFLKKGGIMYVKVYEGDGSGVGHETKMGSWQTNMKTAAYLKQLEEFKPVVKNGIIIIKKEEE